MQISRQTMQLQTVDILKALFALPGFDSVSIKGISPASPDDSQTILSAIDASWHDILSDVDFKVRIAVHPSLRSLAKPLSHTLLSLMGLKDGILGLSIQGNACEMQEEAVETVRLCLATGYRADIIFEIQWNENVPPLSACENAPCPSPCDDFWFIAVQALGKLLRRDYLIADHLAHMLIMEGLVLQMEMRDAKYGTNIHRYGYGEVPAYQNTNTEAFAFLFDKMEPAGRQTAENLCRAALTYNALTGRDSSNESRREIFFALWNCYLQGL